MRDWRHRCKPTLLPGFSWFLLVCPGFLVLDMGCSVLVPLVGLVCFFWVQGPWFPLFQQGLRSHGSCWHALNPTGLEMRLGLRWWAMVTDRFGLCWFRGDLLCFWGVVLGGLFALTWGLMVLGPPLSGLLRAFALWLDRWGVVSC